MENHSVVSPEQWLDARKRLLQEEKKFTQLRDELSRQRRALPWVEVTKQYTFTGPGGQESLEELFGDCSQLIIYHFMFDPEWPDGCKSCSLLADHYDAAVIHLNQRDVAMVTVSRAPLDKLTAFQERMGWKFKWVSSYGTDFNHDFGVTFTPEEIESGQTFYNYQQKPFPVSEAPGMSVFYKDEQSNLFHTYSCYARGLDLFIGAYNLLDLVPKGRDEDQLPYTMAWVRHHDRYDDQTFVDPYLELLADPAEPNAD